MDDVATQNSAPNPDHHRRKLSDLADVMVHLDHTLEDEVRIAHAEVIATMCRAHLTGVYTNLLPDYGIGAGQPWPP